MLDFESALESFAICTTPFLFWNRPRGRIKLRAYSRPLRARRSKKNQAGTRKTHLPKKRPRVLRDRIGRFDELADETDRAPRARSSAPRLPRGARGLRRKCALAHLRPDPR